MKAHTVLFATDFSEASKSALPYAESLAQSWGAELFIVHVLEPAALYTLAGTCFLGSEVDARPKVETMLNNVVPDNCTIRFRHQLLAGDPAKAIVRFAREVQADLIVMTTHGRTGLLHLLLGSVAEYVVRNAMCPVMTLKPGKIVGSPEVAAAAQVKE